jgi:hypothetical protein
VTTNQPEDAEADETWGDVRPFIPEDDDTFRRARMLLLLSVAKGTGRNVGSMDRLGYYEFFADSPYIIIEGNKPRDLADRAALEVAGFSRVQLAYASSGARFMSRRRRLQHDLAQLIAYGLVELTGAGYGITAAGQAISDDLSSVYADAYKQSAEIVLRRLSAKSNAALERSVEDWLGHSWLLVDLLDDITDAEAPAEELPDDEARAKELPDHEAGKDDVDLAEGDDLS